MDNKEFMEKLKFGSGDGNIQYYLYNWKCPLIPAEKVCPAFSICVRSCMFVFYLGCSGTPIGESSTLHDNSTHITNLTKI